MRHRNRGRKFNRTSAHRNAMFKNLVRSLFEHERIITTLEKAKEARPFAERLITLAKTNDLHHHRLVSDRLRCSSKFQPAEPVEVEEEEGKKESEEASAPVQEPPTQRWDIRIVKKLFGDIAPRFKDRPGGYTRILRLPEHRRGDGASRVIFELVESASPTSAAEEKK